MTWEVREGDCVALMAEMPEASVDAIVTDPPYGIGFMGREWDGRAIAEAAARDRATRKNLGPESATRPGRAQPRSSSAFGNEAIIAGPVRGGVDFQHWCEAWAREALRVLKPGGHLLAFGGTRTYHRLACAIEDAGFDVRDCIAWMYGSGFPKSLDVSKAVDRQLGAPRAVAGRGDVIDRNALDMGGSTGKAKNGLRADWEPSDPRTPEGEQWTGWGTALKPAFEPVVVARKPLAGTVATNALKHGTGALNIDGCRVPAPNGSPSERRRESARRSGNAPGRPGEYRNTLEDRTSPERYMEARAGEALGRWPANVALDAEAAGLLDTQSGECPGMGRTRVLRRGVTTGAGMGYGSSSPEDSDFEGYGDTGGASRFFYCAKASGAERGDDNTHPTVKPVELMRWLVRLVTPPEGIVLDPFAGSGTTGIAAMRENLSFIGIEREADYVVIARERIRGDAPLLNIPAEVAA